MRGFESLATGLVLAASLSTAAQAGADDSSGSATSFRVEVRGSVSPSCGLVQSGRQAVFSNPTSSDNKVRGDEVSLDFDISCNTGFTVSLSSLNGGLKSSAWTADPDFTNLVRYTATVSLPGGLLGPACGSIQIDPDGEQCLKIVAGSALPDGVIAGPGRIDLKLVGDTRSLLAGDYSDRLTLTLSPTVSGPGGL